MRTPIRSKLPRPWTTSRSSSAAGANGATRCATIRTSRATCGTARATTRRSTCTCPARRAARRVLPRRVLAATAQGRSHLRRPRTRRARRRDRDRELRSGARVAPRRDRRAGTALGGMAADERRRARRRRDAARALGALGRRTTRGDVRRRCAGARGRDDQRAARARRVAHSFANEWLQLDDARAAALSPTRYAPAAPTTVFATAGERESDAFKVQGRALVDAWRAHGSTTEYADSAGDNHFTVLERLHKPAIRWSCGSPARAGLIARTGQRPGRRAEDAGAAYDCIPLTDCVCVVYSSEPMKIAPVGRFSFAAFPSA